MSFILVKKKCNRLRLLSLLPIKENAEKNSRQHFTFERRPIYVLFSCVNHLTLLYIRLMACGYTNKIKTEKTTGEVTRDKTIITDFVEGRGVGRG